MRPEESVTVPLNALRSTCAKAMPAKRNTKQIVKRRQMFRGTERLSRKWSITFNFRCMIPPDLTIGFREMPHPAGMKFLRRRPSHAYNVYTISISEERVGPVAVLVLVTQSRTGLFRDASLSV